MYSEQRTSLIKAALKRYEGSSSKQSNSLNNKSSPEALLDLIKEGTILYTKGNLFFPRYGNSVMYIVVADVCLLVTRPHCCRWCN